MSTKEDLAKLFNSLKPGDTLIIPSKLPLSKEPVFLYSAVLRLGDKGELYISCPDQEKPGNEPCCHNPIHWDDKTDSFVDTDGEPMEWSSSDIQVDRGDSLKITQAYEQVPRIESARFKTTKEDIGKFIGSPDFNIINSIVRNDEAGDLSQRLSLVLDQLGMDHDTQKLAALESCFHLELTKEHVRLMTHALIARNERTEQQVEPTNRPKSCMLH